LKVDTMAKDKKSAVGRRGFIKGAALAGAAGLAPSAGALNAEAKGAAGPKRIVPPMSPEAEASPPQELEVLTTNNTGSDFMVDVIKGLDLDYICSNPGSSFRGIHESLVNYGGNQQPEFITCCHEESSVAMAHGYAKIEGKPLGVLAHGTVGLQHASMAVYNAYCDRVPVYIILGNSLDASMRRPGVEWVHSVQDAAQMVRDYIKWDDTPISLEHFGDSAARAFMIAMTPPMGPVILVADSELQEEQIENRGELEVPKFNRTSPPQGDSAAVRETAELLVNAENPVIVADRLSRTAAGMEGLIELAETLQAAVIDQGGRLNFPSRHPLNQTARARGVLAQADVILGLEMTDFWGRTHAFRDQVERTWQPVIRDDARLISINAGDLATSSNYQVFQRYTEIDIAMAADAEVTLPALTLEVRRLVTGDRQRVFDQRGASLGTAHQAVFDRLRTDATYAWDASPISTARLSAELWNQIQNEDWSMVAGSGNSLSNWPQRLWKFDRHYQAIGDSGGYGVGYGASAATGAALANKNHGRLSVNIQNDGDLMYGPGVLWTAAHHQIPLLSVMHNNRGYHQEVMHIQRMANRNERGIENATVGSSLGDPNIDFAKVAEGMGVYSEGPITTPADLAPAIQRAIEVVKAGEPALLDVITQKR
jgi:acetolactate synthase-1/2/3 large subunit